MTTNVLIIPPSTALIEAATLMIDRKIGCLVVVDQKKRVDILTESGFVKLAVATATNGNGRPK
ncbi:MAG TPA: CBS domain-containing protein [Myxococcales bacterium]|nr:CBS domain-containing protein [Myxococcales bacterium]